MLKPMSDYYNNTKRCVCQEHTSKIENELTEKFVPRRLQADMLANCYERLHFDRRAERVRECGTYTEWKCYPVPEPAAGLHRGVPAAAPELEQKPRLDKANFCRDRLCPMCSWRRSHKIFSQVSAVMSVIGDDYDFVFVTLTVPNIGGSDLGKEIDKLQNAWQRLSKFKRIQKAFKGFFKALEVTYNAEADTYHPHYHIVFAVNKQYWKRADYITHDELLEMWRKATRNPNITQVDIRRAGKRRKSEQTELEALSASIAEIAKYAVKSSDFLGKIDKTGRVIVPNPDKLVDKVVSVYAAALAGRRLRAFGGVFEEARKQLNLDDPEDGDLIHTDGEIINPDLMYMIYTYRWSCGGYKLVAVARTPETA